MPEVLIVYHSRTGNTEGLARALAEGVGQIDGVEVSLKRLDEATNEDLARADAIVMGCPTYFSLPSAEMKDFVDKSVAVYRGLKGKRGAYFTSCLNPDNGRRTLAAIAWIFGHYGMDVVGELLCTGKPQQADLERAVELGRKIAAML